MENLLFDNKKFNNDILLVKKENIINIDEIKEIKIILNEKPKNIGNFLYYKNLFLGGGTTMKAFIGSNVDQTSLFAIKLENKKHKKSECEIEYLVLKEVKGYEGFPNVFEQGYINGRGYVVESLAGPNLENIITYIGSGFTLSTVCQIGIQLINIIRKLHSVGILHNDLKPSNIGYGLFEDKKIIKDNKIILLDYGYCNRYIYNRFMEDDKGNIVTIGKIHCSSKKTFHFLGTYSFMSEEILKGNPPSRKSELENLIYVLIYLFNGSLPWGKIKINSGSDKYEKILLKRKSVSIKELFNGLPPQLLFIYNSIKELTFYSEPNYNIYINKLEEVLKSDGKGLDCDFYFKEIIKRALEEAKHPYLSKNKKMKIKNLFKGFPIFD